LSFSEQVELHSVRDPCVPALRPIPKFESFFDELLSLLEVAHEQRKMGTKVGGVEPL
jgi:hypothetical protein